MHFLFHPVNKDLKMDLPNLELIYKLYFFMKVFEVERLSFMKPFAIE